MKPLIKLWVLMLMAVLVIWSACKKDDYRDFTKGGELTYSSRLDTAIIAPGKDRLQLILVTKPDPLMELIRVYWNDKTDSMEFKVSSTGQDTIRKFISPLEEGNYNFQIFTYDKQGHSSVAFNATGEVYGSNYGASLTSRIIKSSEIDPEAGGLKLYWGHASVGEIVTRIRYQNKQNDSVTILVPTDTSMTILGDYKANSSYIYQTLFKPTPGFIDTFFTAATKVPFPATEMPVDKSLLSILQLPTDKGDAHGWKMDYLWDENYGTPGMATEDGTDQWFTIDLSKSTDLTRLKIWQAPDRLYEKESVRKFEIWGSNDPNPDGSWDSWAFITACESYKPSGLPVGENSDADIEFAKSGESFDIPKGTTAYRYLRIKMLENWGNSDFMTIGELSFWQKEN